MTNPSSQADPIVFQTVEKRAVLATVAIAILCVPFVVFALLSGQGWRFSR